MKRLNWKTLGITEVSKSPNSKEKYTFCLKHVKEYNKRWNFFVEKLKNQIYEYQKNDFFIGRPTRPFSQGDKFKKLNLNLNILLMMKI